jgi:hypothetical protein
MSSSSNNQSKLFSFRELSNDDSLSLRLTNQEITNLDRSATSQYRVLFWPAYKKTPESYLPDQFVVNNKSGSFTQILNSGNYAAIIGNNRIWFTKNNVKVKEDAGWYRLEYLNFTITSGLRRWQEVKTYTVNIFHPLEDTLPASNNTNKPTVKHKYLLFDGNKDYTLSIPSYLSRQIPGQLSSEYTVSWFGSRAELSEQEQQQAILDYLNTILENIHNALKTNQQQVRLLPWPNDLLEEIINLPGDRGRDIYAIQVGLLTVLGKRYDRAYGTQPPAVAIQGVDYTPNPVNLDVLKSSNDLLDYLKIPPTATTGDFQKLSSIDEIRSRFADENHLDPIIARNLQQAQLAYNAARTNNVIAALTTIRNANAIITQAQQNIDNIQNRIIADQAIVANTSSTVLQIQQANQRIAALILQRTQQLNDINLRTQQITNINNQQIMIAFRAAEANLRAANLSAPAVLVRDAWRSVFNNSLVVAVDNLLKNKRFKQLTGVSSSSSLLDDYFANSIVLPSTMLSINTVVIAKLFAFTAGTFLPQQQEVKRVTIQLSNPADVQIRSELPSSNVNNIIRYNGALTEGQPVWYKFDLDSPFLSLAESSLDQLVNKRIQQRSVNAAQELRDINDELKNGVFSSGQQSLTLSRDISSTGVYLQFAKQDQYTKRVLRPTPLNANAQVNANFNQLRFPVGTVFIYSFGNASTISIPPLRLGSGIYKLDASPYYDSNKYDVEWRLPSARYNPERVSVANGINHSTLIYDYKNPILHIGPVHRQRDFGTYTLRVVTKNPGRLVYEVYFNIEQQQPSTLIQLQNGQKQIASQFASYFSTKNKQLPDNASIDEFNLGLPHQLRYALALYDLMSYYGGNLSQRFQIITEDLRVKLSLDRLFRPPYLRYLPPNLLLNRDRQYILFNPLSAQWEFFQLTQITLDIYKELSVVHPDKIGDQFNYDLNLDQDIVGERLRNAYKSNLALVNVDAVYGTYGGNLPDYYRQEDYGLNRIGFPTKNPNYLPAVLSSQATRVSFFSWVNSQILLNSMTSRFTQFNSTLDVPIQLILIWLRELSKEIRSVSPINRINYASIARQVNKAMDQTEDLLRVEVLTTGKDSILRGGNVSSQLRDAWSSYRDRLPSNVRNKIYTSSVSKILSMIFETEELENNADRPYSRSTRQFIASGRQSGSSYNDSRERELENFRENETKSEKVDINLWRYLVTLNDLFQGDSLSRLPGKLTEQDYVQFLDRVFSISIVIDPTQTPLLQAASDAYRDTLPVYHRLKTQATPTVEKNDFLNRYYSIDLADAILDIQSVEQDLYIDDGDNRDRYVDIFDKTNKLNPVLIDAVQSINNANNQYNQQLQQNPNIIIPQNQQNQPVLVIPKNQAQLPVNIDGIPFNIVRKDQQADLQQTQPIQLIAPAPAVAILQPAPVVIQPLPQQQLQVIVIQQQQQHQNRINELILQIRNTEYPELKYVRKSHAQDLILRFYNEMSKNPNTREQNIENIIRNTPPGQSIGKSITDKFLDNTTRTRVVRSVRDFFKVPADPKAKSKYFKDNFINFTIENVNNDNAHTIFKSVIRGGFVDPDNNPKKKVNAQQYLKLFDNLKNNVEKVLKKYFIDPPTNQMLNEPIKAFYEKISYDIANTAVDYDNGVNNLLNTTEPSNRSKAKKAQRVQLQQLQKYGFDGNGDQQKALIDSVNRQLDNVLLRSKYLSQLQGYEAFEPTIRQMYRQVDVDSLLNTFAKANISTQETLDYINFYTREVPDDQFTRYAALIGIEEVGTVLNSDPYTVASYNNLVKSSEVLQDNQAIRDANQLVQNVNDFANSLSNSVPINDYTVANIETEFAKFLGSALAAVNTFNNKSTPIIDKYANVDKETINDYISRVSKIEDQLLLNNKEDDGIVEHGVRIYENAYRSLVPLFDTLTLSGNIQQSSTTLKQKKLDVARYVKKEYDDAVFDTIKQNLDLIDLNDADSVKNALIAANELDLQAYGEMFKRAGQDRNRFNSIVKDFITRYDEFSVSARSFKVEPGIDISAYVNTVEQTLQQQFYKLDEDISDLLNSYKLAISAESKKLNQSEVSKINLDASTDVSKSAIIYNVPKNFDNTSPKQILKLKSDIEKQLIAWNKKWNDTRDKFYTPEIKGFAENTFGKLFGRQLSGESGAFARIDDRFYGNEFYSIYIKYLEAITEAKNDSITRIAIDLNTIVRLQQSSFVKYLNSKIVKARAFTIRYEKIVFSQNPSQLEQLAVNEFRLALKDAAQNLNLKLSQAYLDLSTSSIRQTLDELDKIMDKIDQEFKVIINNYTQGVRRLQPSKKKRPKSKTSSKTTKSKSKRSNQPPPGVVNNNNASRSSSSSKSTPKTNKPQRKTNNNASSSSRSSKSTQPTAVAVLTGTPLDKLKQDLAKLKKAVDRTKRTRKLFGSPTAEPPFKIFTVSSPLFTKEIPTTSEVNLTQFEDKLEFSSIATEKNAGTNVVLSLIKYDDETGNLFEVDPINRTGPAKGFLIEYILRVVSEKSITNQKFSQVMTRYISRDKTNLIKVPEKGLKKFRTKFRQEFFKSLAKSIFGNAGLKETYTSVGGRLRKIEFNTKDQVSTMSKILDFFNILSKELENIAESKDFKEFINRKVNSEFDQQKSTPSAFSQLLSSLTGINNTNNNNNSNDNSDEPNIITV